MENKKCNRKSTQYFVLIKYVTKSVIGRVLD
ncbi:hypothetical protein Catovirus_2_207 [Catovirus CTV1]|uniref:Uncharacterized protein n=1 Tax=Catovirus CTV1 TaxID=1977631 RepID=A0A1V0SC76_9VIRU|nr:hypothetical protein Catovirus_2_207 [Catovirus CTV1]